MCPRYHDKEREEKYRDHAAASPTNELKKTSMRVNIQAVDPLLFSLCCCNVGAASVTKAEH